MRSLPLILAAMLLGCAGQRASAPTPSVPASEVAPASAPQPPKLRLGDAAQPTRYAVQLTLVPTEDTFQGVIDIELSTREPLPVLWLNAEEITIQKAEARVQGQVIAGKPLQVPRDFVGISFERPLPAGTSTLHIEYTGLLSRKDSDGVNRQQVDGNWYVYTHFEPIDARRAFPCFDEPSFKVPWQFSFKVKKEDVAFTNTPLEARTEGADGYVTYRFAQTLPLPSYLIAFAVGPLERVDAGRAGAKGTPIGVVTPRGMGGQARYAAEVIGQLLARLEDYFGIPYPYEKMDFIAVPYSGGAMEHPGLVTFSLTSLLARPEEETISFRRRLADIATHELAHQWFGDLVTMAWWDDLWLNEAFATWMTPKIMEKWQPTWGVPESRVASRSHAMSADSLVTARRIRQPIESNDDMLNAFDGITYGKGAAVLDMFERWVGPEILQRGIQRYMRKHAHGIATAADFLAAVSAEAGRDIAPAFSTFLDQPGVPLVSMALRCEKGQPPGLELSQRRYLPEGSEGDANSQGWQVPVCVRWGLGKAEGRACTLLTEEKGTLALEAPGCPDWVVPNDAMAGYYRMQPEGDLVAKLLGKARLTVPERVGVLGDLAALVRAGKLPYSEVLGYVPKFAQDPNRAVVQASLNVAGGLRGLGLVPEAQRARYAAYLRSTFGKRARALGFTEKPDEDEDTRLLRASLIEVVADEGQDRELAARARSLAERWISDRKAVSPDMVPAVLSVAAATGDQALFDRLLEAARKEKGQSERVRLLSTLGRFRQPELLKKAFALTLSDEFEPREVARVFWGAGQSSDTSAILYEFLKENFDKVAERLPRDAGGSFPFMLTSLCDDARRAEVAAFFGERAARFTGGKRKLAQALEVMRLCSVFRQKQGPSVERFLQSTSHKPGVAGPR